MMKLDHLSIPVTNAPRSRDWYVETLGLKVEFERPERGMIALTGTASQSSYKRPRFRSSRTDARCGSK
jgi:catechol 2,3-dioxygenase-like lactoylglutathione lyase family enzyme